MSMDFEWIDARHTSVSVLNDTETDNTADEDPKPGEFRVYPETSDNGVGIDGTREELLELAKEFLDAVHRLTY